MENLNESIVDKLLKLANEEVTKEMGLMAQVNQAMSNRVPRTDFSPETLNKLISDILCQLNKQKKFVPNWVLLNKMLEMTDEELQNIPDGGYQISGTLWTGKGGAINFVKTLKQEMVNAKLHC